MARASSPSAAARHSSSGVYPDAMPCLLVTTVTPDRDSAARLAGSAVSAKLAATAKVNGPISSFWWHLGEQGKGEEWQTVFQTTDTRYPQLEAHLVAEHPWNKPEVTAVEMRGNADYLAWVESATS